MQPNMEVSPGREGALLNYSDKGTSYSMLEYTRVCHFYGYTFFPESSGAGYQLLRKILKQGIILLGNCQNFFIEQVKSAILHQK